MTLPLLDGDSVLRSTTPLESASYVDMTLDCLRSWHRHRQDRRTLYQFWQSALSIRTGLMSSKVIIPRPLSGSRRPGRAVCWAARLRESSQGDEVIVSLIRDMGGQVEGKTELTACPSELTGRVIDVEDCPDLVPVLTVLASCDKGITRIIHAGPGREDSVCAMAQKQQNRRYRRRRRRPHQHVAALRGTVAPPLERPSHRHGLSRASQRCRAAQRIEDFECVHRRIRGKGFRRKRHHPREVRNRYL